VNGYLLDTNVALLATSRSKSLSPEVRGAMESGPNYVSRGGLLGSRAEEYEMKGALNVGDPRTWP